MIQQIPTLLEGIHHRRLDETRPFALFFPKAYEPRYAYPLLVFLHGYGESESQWLQVAPAISRRNYIGLSLRGPVPVQREGGATGYSWGRSRRSDGAIEDYVLAAIRATMRASHVHSERIFLAGIGEGAAVAYRLGLSSPDKFAGIVALNGWLPDGPLPPSPLRASRHLGVFIGHGAANRIVPTVRAQVAHQVLSASGLDVTTKLYECGHQLSLAMLKDLDRWLIDRCENPFLR